MQVSEAAGRQVTADHHQLLQAGSAVWQELLPSEGQKHSFSLQGAVKLQLLAHSSMTRQGKIQFMPTAVLCSQHPEQPVQESPNGRMSQQTVGDN